MKDNRPYNSATKTSPCIIHANGWEKQPLIEIVKLSGEITAAQQANIMKLKAEVEAKKVLNINIRFF